MYLMIRSFVPLLLLLVSCDEAGDQSKKKRQASEPAPPAEAETSAPTGGDSTSGAKKDGDTKAANRGKNTACAIQSFNNKLRGSLDTEVSSGQISAKVSGDAALTIKNSAAELTLDLQITSLEVDAGLLSGLARELVDAELRKTTGKRTMLPLTDAENEALKKEGDEWQDYSCIVGMVKEYTFPHADSRVTVEFDPALPFAPYPDQVSQKLFDAIRAGVNFDGITAKVKKVTGPAIDGIAAGDKVDGSVKMAASQGGVKMSYQFGPFEDLKKTGLFESAVYQYADANIDSVVLVSPVEGQDSIEILFE